MLNNRSLEEAHAKCSFYDPYIGEDAGYLQVTRLSGHGPAPLVVPDGKTPFEAYNPILDKRDSWGTAPVFTAIPGSRATRSRSPSEFLPLAGLRGFAGPVADPRCRHLRSVEVNSKSDGVRVGLSGATKFTPEAHLRVEQPTKLPGVGSYHPAATLKSERMRMSSPGKP